MNQKNNDNLKTALKLLKIAKELTATGDDDIETLSNLSRDFTSTNIAEIIPIQYEEATSDGITRMLDNYDSFLTNKQNLLDKYQAYLNELKKLLNKAREYHDKTKNKAEEILQNKELTNFQKVLTKSPQIRTKDDGTKSCNFLKIKLK